DVIFMHLPCLSHVQQGAERIAKFNVKVSIARRVIKFSLYAASLLSLSTAKAYLKTVKDISTIFVCVVISAELFTPGFWNSAKTSFAKRGNRICKLIYSALDTFLIIPNKWHQIDLAQWCQPVKVILCKDLFVISSAASGIWHATEEIAHATHIIEKNTEKLKNGCHIKSRKHLLKVNHEIVQLRQEISGLNTEIHHQEPYQICLTSQLIEKKKTELRQKEGKLWRIFHPNSPQVADYKIKKACTQIDAYTRQA